MDNLDKSFSPMQVVEESSSKMIVEALSNHIGLPAQLPGSQDESAPEIAAGLVHRLLDTVRDITNIPNVFLIEQYKSLHRSLELTEAVNSHDGLLKESIISTIRGLSRDEFVLLHINEQNAAIMVRHQSRNQIPTIVFEISEASPTSQEVLKSSNALVMDFPSCTVALPQTTYNEHDLEDEMAAYLSQASRESVKYFAAHTKKAESQAYESRETVDPIMMTGILMAVLKSQGKSISPPILRKRIRDDVCWDGSGQNPWRRSPMWLILRVAVERHLRSVMGPELGRIQYKLLMCLFHSKFLSEYAACSGRNEEILHHLNKKLVMRIDKLQREELALTGSELPEYYSLRKVLGEIFDVSIHNAAQKMTRVATTKEFTQETDIQNIPRHAEPSSFELKLLNSSPYIEKVRISWMKPIVPSYFTNLDIDPELHHLSRCTFSEKYFKIAELEAEIKEKLNLISDESELSIEKCMALAESIESYIEDTDKLYDKNPEQKSKMLLVTLNLWIEMDKMAIKLNGLLKEYSPGIPTDITNVLLLTNIEDFELLFKIQKYLQKREYECRKPSMTIFEQPSEKCFAVRYYDGLSGKSVMRRTHTSIEEEALLHRKQKKKELAESNANYRSIEDEEANLTHGHLDTWNNQLKCRRCYLQRLKRRLRIHVHEWPLPSSKVNAKILLFELNCPREFAAYRDATWNIIAGLASFSFDAKRESPQLLLSNYTDVTKFSNTSRASKFTIASTTKPFVKTHYAEVKLPAKEDDVLVPNGTNFCYYDTRYKIWSDQLKELSFAHHCNLNFPDSSPYLLMLNSAHFPVDRPGPSSYSIISSQPKCPKGILLPEYLAVKGLFLGYEQRWPQFLIELGSSNINFSSESVMVLVNLLALQVGPSDNDNIRGIVHRVFDDHEFCSRLIYWVDWRLDDISSILRRREVYCMDILITLSLRVFELGNISFRKESLSLIEKARDITKKWLSELNNDIAKSENRETERLFSRYATWAALLCRRTFIVFLGSETIPGTHIRSYIDSSISLQLNFSYSTNPIPESLKAALVRDLKMVWSIRDILLRSATFSEIMPVISRHVSNLSHLSEERLKMKKLLVSNIPWLTITAPEESNTKRQIVAFNLLSGRLIVNGKPVGTLPKELVDNVTFKRLFGTESVRIWPSNIDGMDYSLACKKVEPDIHFGTKDGELIIKAITNGDIFELIPAEKFLGKKISDLPHYLIKDCVHWLNLKQNRIEIRHISNPWIQTPKNWILNLTNFTLHRKISANHYLNIIDPHSSIFVTISNVFKNFEHSNELFVFQASRGPIVVNLPRFDLKFFVNENNRLECTALKSEIDPSQDAGTWYGLKSKLVLREIARVKKNNQSTIVTSNSRSILALIGDLSIKKSGPHVEIKVSSTGAYARFTINQVLGRLDTTDLSNQYLKAYYHAITSCIHPDPLTGRTGTEEAFSCLNSAICQPATPLSTDQKTILGEISNLTPRRNYFPKQIKQMHMTLWNSNMSISSQHDGFKMMVDRIMDKSQKLTYFFAEPSSDQRQSANLIEELTERSLARRIIYDRQLSGVICMPVDMIYSGHSRSQYNSCLAKANKCIQLLQNWSTNLEKTRNMGSLLEEWSDFQGFTESFRSPLLSDLVEMNLASHWGSLVNSMRSANENSKYELMFLLTTIVFNEKINMDAILILIAFALSDELKIFEPPVWPSYQRFRIFEKPKATELIRIMLPLVESPESEDEDEWSKRNNLLVADITRIVNEMIEAWPCASPTCPKSKVFSHNDLEMLTSSIRPEWTRLFQNHQLSNYLTKIQPIMDKICSGAVENYPKTESLDKCPEQEIMSQGFRRMDLPTLPLNLLNGNLSSEITERMIEEVIDDIGHDHLLSSIGNNWQGTQMSSQETHERNTGKGIFNLRLIVSKLQSSQSIIEKRYASDLSKSIRALEDKNREPKLTSKNLSNLHLYINKAEYLVRQNLRRITESCENSMNDRSERLKKVGLWPYIGPISLLELLRSTSDCHLGPEAKQMLVQYAVSITKLQRLHRIREARFKNQKQRIDEELRNPGHTNWDPNSEPDWLLLEIDSNILLRPVQIDVARETISPTSMKNSVLQLNMGQGKTSCIMPMAAASLANGHNLVRVIVPRALLAQNIQLLQIRLGGLVGREIKHIPFSRKLAKNPRICNLYLQQFEYIQKSKGIMVTLPEHIMSFKLSGQQALSDGRPEAREMIEAQRWISSRSRDIIDECDEILALRTQLIYPSGTQKIVDGHPSRWETTESILRLVVSHVEKLQNTYPQSISITLRADGSFPLICFVEDQIGELLISRIADEICSGQSQILPRYSAEDRRDIKEFICKTNVEESAEKKIELLTKEKPIHRQIIYLLRGLLVHEILTTSLKKRWNVQYGLHPHRDPIAVPFYAKGCPSEQSEWGHPDVAITLTCLAFYHEGVNLDQFHNTLRNILQTDDPVQVYDRLIKESRLPQSYTNWNNINVEDELMVKDIWKSLRYSMKVINFFLNIFVFPKHATQFAVKLTTTGWDIPSFELERIGMKNNPARPLTTGFSGTNDWKGLLPLTICQQDLVSLSHTNAEVLSYLLQDRNKEYYQAADANGKRLSEQGFLLELSRQNITVLIDAGAQIMEMDNYTLAKAWLDINQNATAAFFFNQENKPRILYKGGRQVSFYSSIFAENLQGCLVYLDQAHTRGTDLKLDIYVKGALTLGPNQTKDHTVQAAMRLRQLGSTQSIVFFAPPEVHQSIISLGKRETKVKLTSNDVVSWLLKQTCHGIELLLPCYYIQGVEFCKRTQAALQHSKIFDKSLPDCTNFLSAIQQKEALSLVELYGTNRDTKLSMRKERHPLISDIIKQLKYQCKQFLSSGNDFYASAMQEVEQERDILTEVQAICQYQKPVHYYPQSFPGLHPDIFLFLNEGILSANSNGYDSAFDFIHRTVIGKNYGIKKEATSQKLYVSVEYGRIAKQARGIQTDHLFRPVNWILWSKISQTGLVIIPEEAEVVICLLRTISSPVHLLSYAPPMTRRMLSFNDFDFFNIPSMSSDWCPPMWLRIEVGILAGRHYFDFSEYAALVEYLGVQQIEDGLIEGVDEPSEVTEQLTKTPKGFTTRPLSFLQEWLALRGHGQDFGHTPMGHICQGRVILKQNQITHRLCTKQGTLKEDENDEIIIDESKGQQEDRDDYLAFESILFYDENRIDFEINNDKLADVSSSESEHEKN